MSAGSDLFLANGDELTVDDLAEALSSSGLLHKLEITDDDLVLARNDEDLLETLRITYEVLSVLRGSGVFETFLLLPEMDQANFLRWIGMTDDTELRGDRIKIFVSALTLSPLTGSDGVRRT